MEKTERGEGDRRPYLPLACNPRVLVGCRRMPFLFFEAVSFFEAGPVRNPGALNISGLDIPSLSLARTKFSARKPVFKLMPKTIY